MPVQAKVRVRRSVGPRVAAVAAAGLVVALCLVAPHARPSFGSVGFDLEMVLVVELMGVAAWRIWRIRTPAARSIVALYFVQLVVNAAWSGFFFGLRQPTWALADIAVLWVLLVWIQVGLPRLDRLAAWLWLPYLLWVSFASLLNTAIVRLN